MNRKLFSPSVVTYQRMNAEIVNILRMEGHDYELYAAARIEELEAGLRELRRWVGDGDLSESFGWDNSVYTPEYRAVLDATDALLRPNASGEARHETR